MSIEKQPFDGNQHGSSFDNLPMNKRHTNKEKSDLPMSAGDLISEGQNRIELNHTRHGYTQVGE